MFFWIPSHNIGYMHLLFNSSRTIPDAPPVVSETENRVARIGCETRGWGVGGGRSLPLYMGFYYTDD